MIEQDLQRILDEISCDPFEFEIGSLMGSGHWWVRVRKFRQADGLEWKQSYGPKHLITPGMTIDMIVRKCLQAARDFADYEVLDGFYWRGRKVFAADIETVWKAL